MKSSHFDHPSEEALERFLLHNCQEEELDGVESHIMACDGCVARLEQLEIQQAVMKLALSELPQQSTAPVLAQRSLKDWFNLRTVSWAGAVAAVALTVSLTPHFLFRPDPVANVDLVANRGTGITTVPQGKALHLHLSAPAIQNGPVQVVLVDGNGSEVWKGSAEARNEQVEVSIPKVAHPGTHFLRLYSQNSPADLLREFPFQVN